MRFPSSWETLSAEDKEATMFAAILGGDIGDAVNSLLPALFQAFSVILVGYACVKLNVVSTAHKQGLSLFVTRLALPALLFSGMANLDFSMVNWYFLLAVTIGKTTVFFVAMGLTILLDVGKPNVLGTAGVHGIFVSQSNDFALGLPILLPVFGKTHPDYIGYLYLVAPISLIFLNPIGFLFMEAGRGREEAEEQKKNDSLTREWTDAVPEGSDEEASDPPLTSRSETWHEAMERVLEGGREADGGLTHYLKKEAKARDPSFEFLLRSGSSVSWAVDDNKFADGDILPSVDGNLDEKRQKLTVWEKRKPSPVSRPVKVEEEGIKMEEKGKTAAGGGMDVWKVLYGVVSSPVVFMVPVGLLANVIFDHNIPPLVSGPFETFGSAFSPLSLFILGMSMADQTESTGSEETELGPLVVAIALIAGKCLLLPLVIALVLINCNVSTSLVVAGLLYGALPVTPATFFFACEYGLCQAWIGMATVLGTFIFGPLVYVMVQLAFLIMNHFDAFEQQVLTSARTMSVIGALGAMWTLLALLLNPRRSGLGGGESLNPAWDEFKEHRRMEKCFICCIAISWLSCCLASLTCGTELSHWLRLLRYFALACGPLAAPIFTTTVALLELWCAKAGPTTLQGGATWQAAVAGWLVAAGAAALPPVLAGVAPVQDEDLITCWFPYGAPQFYSFGAVNCVCISLVGIIICIIIADQYDGARLAGKSFLWTNLRLTWRAPQAPHFPPPATPPPAPVLLEPSGTPSGTTQPYDWPSQPPSRQSSVRSRLSIRDAMSGRTRGSMLEGARRSFYEPSKWGANGGLTPVGGGGEGFGLPSAVSQRWKQRTDIDEQNGVLLFCAYSSMAMLVFITTSLLALWNGCKWDKNSSQSALLLLLHTVLGFGQGAVLFLAYGLHPGLVEPLVWLREWWVEHRNAVFAEEMDPQERPKWTDVLGGEVDDCGPRYEKVWRRLSNGSVLQPAEWETTRDDDSIHDDAHLRDLDERVSIVTEDTMFDSLLGKGSKEP